LLFNSFEFIAVFLPIVLIAYYLLSHRAQNAFLVLASVAFYASWDWRFIFPLLFTSGLDYWISKRLEYGANHGWPKKRNQKYLTISIVSNLTLLGFFKYFNFFTQSLHDLLWQVGFNTNIQTLNIVLPVAISFYTFQALSYTIDVYRGELHATNSFWEFFLAVLYFPHLVAGPIQRASLLLPQVTQPRVITAEKIKEGVHLIIWGFVKKVYMADNLSPIVEAAFSDPSPNGGTTTIGVLAFCFQIYCDFSGYTDIARGLAKIMGFEFSLNFNLPYISRNPSEFWRRWHISLSSWLRDYLYKPLGGNRGSSWTTNRNLLITMLLGGLWHGAAWNFVIWGFYHGVLLIGHRLATPVLSLGARSLGRIPGLWPVICWLTMFILTCYGWLLFRASSIDQIVNMTASLVHPFEELDWKSLHRVLSLVSPLILVQAIQWKSNTLYFLDPRRVPTAARIISYSIMIYAILFLGGQAQSFVYFQF
jgi:alginate O-acetyltransferase complex protein AlgI